MADLTTLAKARQQLFGNDPEPAADTIISQLITSSSAWVEREVGGDILTASITETFDGDGGTTILLTRSHSWRPGCPATVVTALTVDGTAIPARAAVTALDTNPSGYICRADRIDLVGYTFTVGTKNVSVTYTAGYATVPTDIEQAVLEHVAIRYRDRGHAGIDAATGGGESVSYANAGSLAFIDGVLSGYRVLGFV